MDFRLFLRNFAVMKIVEAIEKFLCYISTERRLSERTVRSYSITLREFSDFLTSLGLNEIEEVSSQEIRLWQVSLVENGLEPGTVNRCIVTLRSFYKYLRRQKIMTVDVMAKVTSPKLAKHLPIFFREKEVENIYNNDLFPDTFEGHRDQLILQMLYETGMRRAEMAGLTESSVDLSNLTIKVLGKRDKERYIPIKNELAHNISNYLSLKRGINNCSEAFFVRKDGSPASDSVVYGIVKKYMTAFSQAERISPHIFRHSFATHLLNEGADINAIKELLGHTDLMATEVYTHVTREHLKEAYKHAHPRATKK